MPFHSFVNSDHRMYPEEGILPEPVSVGVSGGHDGDVD